MTYSFQYYSYWEIVEHRSSRAEILMKELCKISPDLNRMRNHLYYTRSIVSTLDLMTRTRFRLHGMYALYENNTLVSVATIGLNKIDRVITMPRFRHKGHATYLIKHITKKMMDAGIQHVFCPVEPSVEPLFEKMGWVKIGRTAPDGTHDFVPASCENLYTLVSRYDYGSWLIYLASILRRTGSPTIRL